MRDLPASPPPLRWTPERQCAFLRHLDRNRSPTLSAELVGMSRESAYRCRAKDPTGLFALMWNDVMTRPPIVRRRVYSVSTSL